MKTIDLMLSVFSTREHRECLEVRDMLSALIVAVAPWVYVYFQTHRDVHVKSVQFIINSILVTLFVDIDKIIQNFTWEIIKNRIGKKKEGEINLSNFKTDSCGYHDIVVLVAIDTWMDQWI